MSAETAQSAQPALRAPKAGHDLSLWCAVLGAPFLFLSHLQIEYMLVPWVCATGHRLVLPLVSAGFLLLTLLGGYVAWREFQHVGGGEPDPHADPPIGRSHLLSTIGIMSAALFSLGIIAQAIATLMLDPCAQ